MLRRAATSPTPLHGKDLLPAAGEYTVEAIARGLLRFADRHAAGDPDDAPAPAGSTPTAPRRASVAARSSARRCRRGRRSSASAAPSGRCSRR